MKTESDHSQPIPDIVPVQRWDSYEGLAQPGQNFLMEVTDHRKSLGQITVDVAPEDGEIDDIFSVSLQVAPLPGTNTPVPASLVHFSNGELALTIFKVGDELRILHDRGISIEPACDRIGGSRVYAHV